MAHAPPDLDLQDRTRDRDDNASQQINYQANSLPGTVIPSGGQTKNISNINYVLRPDAERLGLIQGDADTFADIINLVGEYEGALDRQESLAANLGAKLTGPRLLRGIEKFFEGPIRASSSQPFGSPISWLDVVSFAKTNPNEFILTAMPDGSRCCRFVFKGIHVEITEDDWRLISSGALDRFPLEHPFEEDEVAEMATLDILEQRASILYKKADEVAARARILHHKLGHRKNDLARRRGQDNGGPRFRMPNYTSGSGGPSTSYDLRADLLQQFLKAPSSIGTSRSTSGAGLSVLNLAPLSPSVNSPHHQHRLSNHSIRSPVGSMSDSATTSAAESRGEMLRALISLNTDRLSKGDTIHPPCDRCRRLRLPCIKHLTACQGCTKKHAKCSWKSVTDEEATRVRYELGMEVESPSQDSELLAARENRSGRPTLESVASLLSTESTSRPASRADTDMGISMVRSPDSMSGGRLENPNIPPGYLGSSITREPLRPGHRGSAPPDTEYFRRVVHESPNPPSR